MRKGGVGEEGWGGVRKGVVWCGGVGVAMGVVVDGPGGGGGGVFPTPGRVEGSEARGEGQREREGAWGTVRW